jgi:TetR/AcrR family fatty acid metabolism transcriptional regulator
LKAGNRKQAIVEAATECFAKRGYHDTSISDIIDDAGIARGTFYLYFKSKQDVFRFILDGFIKHIGDQIKTIKLGGKVSPADQMRANVERLVDAILGGPAPAKIVLNEAVGLNPEIDDKLRSFYGKLISMIEKSIAKGVALKLVRPIDPRLAACIVIGAFKEVMIQKTVFKQSRFSKKIIVDGLIDALIGGLGGRPVIGI